MNKIINGKRYDTTTAELLNSNSYGSPRDFQHWTESLYRKKTGEYFLYGEGGPASRYAVSESVNSWSGGEKIIPLTDEAAMKWAEDNLTGDEYMEIFGEPDEDAEAHLNFRVTAAEAEKLKTAARNEDVSQLALLKRWLGTL